MMMKTIQKISICFAMLLCISTAMGATRVEVPQSDTLSAEEQQQFLYYLYEAQRLIQKEDIESAWQLVQFCYELNPNDATVNNYMAIFYDAFKEPQKALPYLRRAFELQPNEYWYQYAIYLLQSGNKKSEKTAIRNLEFVASNNPEDEEVHTLLQKAYIHVKDFKRALLIQDKLDSIVGYNAMSAMQRYRISVMMNNIPQAVREVERYVEEEPNDIQFQAFRLEVYEHTNQPSDKLIEAYLAVLPYDPHNLIIKNNLAWHLCISNRGLEMAEHLSRATIMADPTNPVYLDTYAWVMYKLGNYHDALFYILQAMENANPDTRKEIITHKKAIIKKLNRQ